MLRESIANIAMWFLRVCITIPDRSADARDYVLEARPAWTTIAPGQPLWRVNGRVSYDL
jgi:hypothetical protein